MNLLVGKALEEDEQFWNQGLFADAGSDDDYDSKEESASAAKDSFDSDFEDSDKGDQNDNDEEGSDEEGKPKKKKKVTKRANDDEDEGVADRELAL